MKTTKYRGVKLNITESAQERRNTHRAVVKEDIKEVFIILFVPMIFSALLTCLCFCNHLHQIYTELNSSSTPSRITMWFFIVFIMYTVLSYVVICTRDYILYSFCEKQSKRMLNYLPLSDEACQELGICNINDYCDFLNHFLFRRPFGGTYKNMSLEEAIEKYSYCKIAEMSYPILQEINQKYRYNNQEIYYDKEECYYKIRTINADHAGSFNFLGFMI